MQLLILTILLLSISSAHEYRESNFLYLGRGHMHLLIIPPFGYFNFNISLIECSAESLIRGSHFFDYNTVTHRCKQYLPDAVALFYIANNSDSILFYKNYEWIIVYSLRMGAHSKINRSFFDNGKSNEWNIEYCIAGLCPNFFRHPILSFWETLPIEEVKLVIYRNETAVVNLLFNGRKTTRHNWFSLNNLKSSPWNDIDEATTFSIAGDGSFRFYIAKPGNCSTDRGWLIISEVESGCDWLKEPHSPVILYSNKSSSVLWKEGYAMANSFAVFLRMR